MSAKNNHIYPFIIAGAGAFVLLMFVSWMTRSRSFRLHIGPAVFTAEVALTEPQKVRGLGGRDALLPNHGMLFVYDHREQYEFWMRDMRFPLDFVWIDGSVVSDITRDVPPPTGNERPIIVKPSVPVDRVFEIAAGTADRLGIAIGDRVEYLDR